jgi:hypothetical protein
MTESLDARRGERVACTTEEALLVDDVVLLAAPRARSTRSRTALSATIGAAAFVDLALQQRVEARPGVFSTYLVALGEHPPEDRALRLAWERVAAHPTNARVALLQVGEVLFGPVRARLEDAGHLQVRSRLAAGIRRHTVLPVGDRHHDLLERIRGTSAGARPDDSRAALLIDILAAGGRSVWPQSLGVPRQRGSARNDDDIRTRETVTAIARTLAGMTA